MFSTAGVHLGEFSPSVKHGSENVAGAYIHKVVSVKKIEKRTGK